MNLFWKNKRFLYKQDSKILFTKTLAFTLAEILIVIGIIGIVAEMVIPGVVANTTDAYSLAMVKEDFSIIQQAIKMAEVNEGSFSAWYNGNANIQNANTTVNQVLSKYLRVSKNCGATQGCFSPNPYKALSSSSTVISALTLYVNIDNTPTRWSTMMLSNGSSLAMGVWGFNGSDPNSTISGIVFIVDVNGLKAPNRWGYDTFLYELSSTAKGSDFHAIWNPATNNDNNITGCYSSAASSNFGGIGGGCSGWAVYNSTVKYKNGELLP